MKKSNVTRKELAEAVAERLGFQLEATLRNELRVADGSLRDTRIYGAVQFADLKAPA